MFKNWKINKKLLLASSVILPAAAIAVPVIVVNTKKADGFLQFIVNWVPEKNLEESKEGRKFYRDKELISTYKAEGKVNIYNIFWSDTVVWRAQSYSKANTTETPYKLQQVKKVHLSGIGSPSLSLRGTVASNGPSGTAALDFKTEVTSHEVSDTRENANSLFTDITVDAWIWKISGFASDVVSWFYFGNSTYSVSAAFDKDVKTVKYFVN